MYDLVAQEQSVVTQFRGWLQGVSSSMTPQEWIVFDGFSSETASGPALQLIHDLGLAAADYLLGPLRVTVCGYEGSPPLASGALSESLRAPTEEEVKDFFDSMSRSADAAPDRPRRHRRPLRQFVAEGGRWRLVTSPSSARAPCSFVSASTGARRMTPQHLGAESIVTADQMRARLAELGPAGPRPRPRRSTGRSDARWRLRDSSAPARLLRSP